MPSRIEQALDQLADVATGRVVPWSEILTALRAAAAFQASWDRCITIRDLDALTVMRLRAALNALDESVLGPEVSEIPAVSELRCPDCGGEMVALTCPCWSEEVPTDAE